MRIYKYPYNPETGEVTMPDWFVILRVDHVDDGFYKGDFLWAIVNETDENVPQKLNLPLGYSLVGGPPCPDTVERIQLGVREDQTIQAPGRPCFAREENGKIYVYAHDFGRNDNYRIVVFKTGQEINIPFDKLSYLGLNRLWIIQELGLYTFLVTP